jgi:hypothetical protein
MMTGIIITAGLVGYGFALFYALEAESVTVRWVCRAIVFLGFAWLVQTMVDGSASGPCLNWETQMHYNAATKTMMPARVCTSRGEWVDEN